MRTGKIAAGLLALAALASCTADDGPSPAEQARQDRERATSFGAHLAEKFTKDDIEAQLGVVGMSEAVAKACVGFAKGLAEGDQLRRRHMQRRCVDSFAESFTS